MSETCAYPADARIAVHPFEQRVDGEDVIIANESRTSFLCVPPDAVQLLTWLAEGRTVGEVRAIYEHTYGVTPDLDEYLATLAAEDFLRLPTADSKVERKSENRRYHFENIPVDVARRLVSPGMLVGCGCLVALGLLACVVDPGVLPPPTALVFEHDALGLFPALVLISLVTVFGHELAHLLAARAAGVPSRLGVGSRLWILVAETDMTGVWLASRAQRCLAFLAGPIFDLALCATLLLVLFADRQHWLAFAPNVIALLRASLFVAFSRVLWQFEFFVPTDLYYVIGALFGCKNLMQDTQTYLVNQFARVIPRIQPHDQASVPPREMRVIRWFAVVWLAGRAVAFGMLFWITLPVLAGYGLMLARAFGGDTQASALFLTGPLLPIVAAALQTIGLLVWLHGLARNRNRTRRSIR